MNWGYGEEGSEGRWLQLTVAAVAGGLFASAVESWRRKADRAEATGSEGGGGAEAFPDLLTMAIGDGGDGNCDQAGDDECGHVSGVPEVVEG